MILAIISAHYPCGPPGEIYFPPSGAGGAAGLFAVQIKELGEKISAIARPLRGAFPGLASHKRGISIKFSGVVSDNSYADVLIWIDFSTGSQGEIAP